MADACLIGEIAPMLLCSIVVEVKGSIGVILWPVFGATSFWRVAQTQKMITTP